MNLYKIIIEIKMSEELNEIEQRIEAVEKKAGGLDQGIAETRAYGIL